MSGNNDNKKNECIAISDSRELSFEKELSTPASLTHGDGSHEKTLVKLSGKNPTVINNAENVNITENINISDQDVNHILMFFKKAISKKRILLYIVLVGIICALAFFLYGKYKDNRLYEETMELAQSDMNSGDYIEAAKKYHYAAVIAPSTNSYVTATCMEANAYMVLGIVSDSESSPLYESYYDKAIKLFYNIISNSKYKNAEYYYDAAAGLCDCYLFSNYSMEDECWVKTVEILEGYVENISPEQDYFQVFSVYLALSLYYEKLTKVTMDNMSNTEYQMKSLEYSLRVCELLHYYKNANGTVAMPCDVGMVAELMDRIIMYSISIKEPYDYIPKVIRTCNDIINDIDTMDYYIDHYSYHSINYVLGKAYIFMGMADDAGNKQYYYLSAYNTLIPFLNDNGIISELELTNTAYYCVLTGMCSEEDIRNIELIMKKAEDKIFSDNPTADELHQAVQILDIYSCIVGIYNEDEIKSNANQLIGRISTYKYLLSSLDKDELEELSAFFSGEIGFEETSYGYMIDDTLP